MICTYFTIDKNQLFQSLTRYFYYVLNTELVSYELSSKIKSLLFFVQEEKDAPQFLKLISDNKEKSFIQIGYDKTSRINILDAAILKDSLLSILEHEFMDGIPLFTKTELIIKAKKFLKDHGEETLLDSFNDVRYRLSNGIKLFLVEELLYMESKENFLIPGINSWVKFKEKFERYRIFLEMLGFQKEIQELSQLILSCNQFMAKTCAFANNGILEYDEDYLNVHIDLLSKINEILYNISTLIDNTDAGL